ncbi:MAG TPA: DUF1801 domain-containing protein [Planctomycetota bacterium]|nr:DUF1801 domain-containing protein [Planctomycetota bacterium]
MGQKNPNVDQYIAASGDFARPILRQLRAAVHRGCPGVTEELKWNAPFFVYKGLLCMMAAFKKHCTFGFWKHALLQERVKELQPRGSGAMDRFVRLHSLVDLPDQKMLVQLVKEAAVLNEKGIQIQRNATPKKERVLAVPESFMKAVRANRKARATFDAGSYTFRKEYVDWVREAKTEETRERRLRTAVAWMAQGKSRNWKYEK